MLKWIDKGKIMNILKKSSIIENSEYKKMFKDFDFERIWERVSAPQSRIYRFFKIEHLADGAIKFTPTMNLDILTNIVKIEPLLELEEKAQLLEIRKTKTFRKYHKNRILIYLHLDWVMIYNKLREYETGSAIPQPLLDDFYLITGKNPKDVIKGSQAGAKQRSNIYTINKDSIIVSKFESDIEEHLDRISEKTIALIKENDLISFIEISKDIDEDKLQQFLVGVNKACFKMIKQEPSIKDNMRFCLKIRKIKRTLKKAMYIQNQNSIIVDPRHTDSFYHELGHWYHTYFRPDIKTVKQAEDFAEKFALQFL